MVPWMMMKFMESIDFRGKDVLDYGCGTGILSILASKCGAKNIAAVDIEKESFDNTVDNSNINDTIISMRFVEPLWMSVRKNMMLYWLISIGIFS